LDDDLPAPGNLSPGMAGNVESVLHAINSTFSRAKYAVAIASLLQHGSRDATFTTQYRGKEQSIVNL
jgi:hypothetical protein